MKKKNIITIVWSVEDVIGVAETLGFTLKKKSARDILKKIKRRHDAEIGINWGVISWNVQDYFCGCQSNEL